MKNRPLGVTIISLIYLAAAGVNTGLLITWLFSRASLVAFIESVNPSASLGPALLLEIPGIVTVYFISMAVLCFGVGWSLWKLHRWSWFVTCGFAVLAFALDAGLFAHMLPHLSLSLLALGILRFALRLWILVYLNRRSIRAVFGLSRTRALAA